MIRTKVARSTCDVRVLAALWVLPLVWYTALIGQWSLSGDEYYTLVDSSKPVAELLSYERKPLYYLVCHFLLQLDLGLPTEVVIRLPAALAASFIPPTFYCMLATKRLSNVALFAALIALANPWLFQMSQFGRFYSLSFLFASISALAGYRWLFSPSLSWLGTFVVSGLLAGVSHTPAAIVLPAGIVALSAARFRDDPIVVGRFMRKFGVALVSLLLVSAVVALYILKDVIYFWLGSEAGAFGNYSVTQILVALAVFGGVSTWILALVPLMRFPTSWNSSDVYLLLMIICSSVPLLALVPFGGGVAARYLMVCMPCMFVLAARHWYEIDGRLPSFGYRAALAGGLLAFNLPYLASVYSDGGHLDYRGAAKTIESMNLEHPVIFSATHRLLEYYMDDTSTTHELDLFESGVPRELIQKGIDMANKEGRPLLLVSREDRSELSRSDQNWLYSRFAVVRTFYRPRFDHRRYRMVIYQYRPDPNELCNDYSHGQPTATQDSISLPIEDATASQTP